jgi:hypothetical protein
MGVSQGRFILFFVGAGSMTSLDFAEAARRLAEATRRAGHAAPGFRSPPRSTECRRSIRRRRTGEAVIAVQMKQRPSMAVLADMIDGVIAANRLGGIQAADLRDLLWAAVADLAADLAPSPTERTAEVRAIRAA